MDSRRPPRPDAQMRAPYLYLRKPAACRPPPRLLRSVRRGPSAKTVQAKIGRPRIEGPSPSQPIRLPRSMRTRPEHSHLPRRRLVRQRYRIRRGRNRRVPHPCGKAGRPPAPESRVPEHAGNTALASSRLLRETLCPRGEGFSRSKSVRNLARAALLLTFAIRNVDCHASV